MIARWLCLMLTAGTLVAYEWTGDGRFKDGARVADHWTCLWLGYGTGSISRGQLWLTPAVATSNGVTHSALVRSDFTLGPTWTISASATTDAQLRTAKVKRKVVAAPKPWEVAWLIAKMTQDGSGGLYFILKTNGVELGAYADWGNQCRFLFTSNSPCLVLGKTYQYQMVNDGQGVAVLVDGTAVAGAPVSAFIDWPLGDRIGLYTEDAAVHFGPVTVIN